MTELVGKTLGKYQILEKLGRGGMADVYRAYHPSLDRFVAIKVMHGHLAEGKDFQARFQLEARAVASLRHGNIVQVHDFDIELGIYYMVMEYIESVSLKTKLDELKSKGQCMSLVNALNIFIQIANALSYAHQQGMLHRDIKPANVLLDKYDHAYLTDFGIAKIFGEKQLTVTGALIGTPQYMSPEQCMGKKLTEASDVYSLGITLYEMLTCITPFDADTPFAIIQKQISSSFDSPRKYRLDIPDTLENIIYKALVKESSDRFQTVQEMISEVSKVLIQLSGEKQIKDETNKFGANAINAIRIKSLTQLKPIFLRTIPVLAIGIFFTIICLSIGLWIYRNSKSKPENPSNTSLATSIPSPGPANNTTSTSPPLSPEEKILYPTLTDVFSPTPTIVKTTESPIINISDCPLRLGQIVHLSNEARFWTKPTVTESEFTLGEAGSAVKILTGPEWGRIRLDIDYWGWWWEVGSAENSSSLGWVWEQRLEECR